MNICDLLHEFRICIYQIKKNPFFLAWYTIAYILPLFISPSIRNQQTAVIDFNMLIKAACLSYFFF